jgi:protein-S-isoprenylcysteine O-methyltransferase Ste14
MFHTAPLRSTRANLFWTSVQSAVIWGLTLGVGPVLIVLSERALSIAAFEFPGQRVIALALLLACSVLNVASGAALAMRGRGTPLPTACPRQLVVDGPYRFVRNPMAIGGIGQGIAVALALGSWGVLLYAVAGALFWHVCIRPFEERDLARRFGESYVAYRTTVPLWRPRRRAFVP